VLGLFFLSRRHKDTEVRLKLAVDGSGDSVAHECFAKIQQISKFEAGEAEVGQQLLLVGWRHVLD